MSGAVGATSNPVRVNGSLNLGTNQTRGQLTFIYGEPGTQVIIDSKQVHRDKPGATIQGLDVFIPLHTRVANCFLESDPKNPNVFTLNPNRNGCLIPGAGESPGSISFGVRTDQGEVIAPGSYPLNPVLWTGR